MPPFPTHADDAAESDARTRVPSSPALPDRIAAWSPLLPATPARLHAHLRSLDLASAPLGLLSAPLSAPRSASAYTTAFAGPHTPPLTPSSSLTSAATTDHDLDVGHACLLDPARWRHDDDNDDERNKSTATAHQPTPAWDVHLDADSGRVHVRPRDDPVAVPDSPTPVRGNCAALAHDPAPPRTTPYRFFDAPVPPHHPAQFDVLHGLARAPPPPETDAASRLEHALRQATAFKQHQQLPWSAPPPPSSPSPSHRHAHAYNGRGRGGGGARRPPALPHAHATHPPTPHPINANPHHAPPDKNKLDIPAIERGVDTRTTVMIKNIPNKMSDADLLAWMAARGGVDGDDVGGDGEWWVDAAEDGGGGGGGVRNEDGGGRRQRRMTIDFFYLRMDFGNGCNVGYAFVNFISVQGLLAFARRNLGVRWNMYASEKVLQLSYADYQGKEALVEKFKNSGIMDVHPAWRPRIFFSAGPRQGTPEPFPAPTHLKRKERSRCNRVLYGPGAGAGGGGGGGQQQHGYAHQHGHGHGQSGYAHHHQQHQAYAGGGYAHLPTMNMNMVPAWPNGNGAGQWWAGPRYGR